MNSMNRQTNKAKLDEIFEQLRREGYLALQNHLCCSSCAGYNLAERASKLKDGGVSVKGCVFYHAQDAASLKESSGDGWLALRYGPLETTKHSTIGDEDVVTGRHLAQLCRDAGLSVDWDGSGSTVIFIDMDAFPPKTEAQRDFELLSQT